MGAYDPEVPAKRPGGKPINAPKYRILVHRKYEAAWNQIVERVGLQQAQQFWDHVAYSPGSKDPIANSCFLRGKAGTPISSLPRGCHRTGTCRGSGGSTIRSR